MFSRFHSLRLALVKQLKLNEKGPTCFNLQMVQEYNSIGEFEDQYLGKLVF